MDLASHRKLETYVEPYDNRFYFILKVENSVGWILVRIGNLCGTILVIDYKYITYMMKIRKLYSIH